MVRRYKQVCRREGERRIAQWWELLMHRLNKKSNNTRTTATQLIPRSLAFGRRQKEPHLCRDTNSCPSDCCKLAYKNYFRTKLMLNSTPSSCQLCIKELKQRLIAISPHFTNSTQVMLSNLLCFQITLIRLLVS